MTATLPPRAPAPPPSAPLPTSGPAPSAGRPAEWDVRNSAPRRTLLALLATALGATPLKALLTDWSWLVHGWLTMAVVIAPACLIRLRRAPSALDVWPGIILLVPWLTLVYVPHHAWGGLIPNGATLHDVRTLMQDLHHTTATQVAPVHSTVAIRLVVSTLLGLLAALVDLVAVVGRRGALAGVPLLVVFTVAGAVPRSPVAWGWFVVSAIGFLLLLGLDADDELRDWGRRIARRGVARGRPGVGISAQRIGLLAVLVAVALPALAPDQSRNLIADAFHNGHGSGIGDFGAGGGGNGSISPFAALKGQLDRSKPVTVASVHVVSGPRGQVPFYLKTNVLEHYTSDVGWSVGDHGPTEPIEQTSFGSEVEGRPQHSLHFETTITIKGLTGNVPVFTSPDSIFNVQEGTRWSPRDGILLGGQVDRDQRIRETFDQPAPTVAELRAAPRVADGQLARYLQLPGLPRYVIDLVQQLTANEPTPYDKARALSDYFADPTKGFFYSLKTKPGDSGSALVDFLKTKQGYCQQYAAALAVMLRQAGIPSRVVLGYMHVTPDRAGNFDVSTLDAHAWDEAYFPGVGWVPFDPTPASGLSGGQASDLKWAPHQYAKGGNDQRPTISRSPGARPTPTASTSSSAAPAPVAADGGGGTSWTPLWVLAGVLVAAALVLTPAGVRTGRRRRRYQRARHGDADALWAELSDTVVDLGYRWSPTRSPRQVAAWLRRDAGASAPALDRLAGAVERWRYAPAGASAGEGGALVSGWDDVAGTLRARRPWRLRLRALLWPASLGWTPRRGLPRRLRLRRH